MADSYGRNVGRKVDPTRFAMVPRTDVPRSAFDVQHSHKTTFNAGLLIPLYVDEVLPGDSHRVKMTALVRLATAVVPVMDDLILESFFFFVPNRLVWENWTRFMGEQDTPLDTTEFLVPQITGIGDSQSGSATLYNYFGIHNQLSGFTLSVNALPFRAYNLIYNEWFRDQDLVIGAPEITDDGPTAAGANYPVLRRGKRHDYFTSARPWPQKPVNQSGQAFMGPVQPGQSMFMPQSGAPVTGLGVSNSPSPGNAVPLGLTRDSGHRLHDFAAGWATSSATFRMRADELGAAAYPDVRVLVNDIRTASAVQVLLERNARGGTRYTELVRAHFGVVSPDARLQRPEYLGGGRTYVTINPVAQLSASGATGTTTPLGSLAAVGTANATGHGFSGSFTEHGYIIGLVSIRAPLTYQQGINRMWYRRTQFDFYWPSLAHLGEQAILRREIYALGGVGSNDETVFGYQERWSEYKYMPNRVSGLFRSRDPLTLDVWHFGQNFLVAPLLNEGFVEENPPVARVLQVDEFDGVQFLIDALFDARKVRCMPMFSIPGLGPRL